MLNAGGEGSLTGFHTGVAGLRPSPGSTRPLDLGNTNPPFLLSSPAQPAMIYGRWLMKVELLLAPGCPNASAARALLAGCLHRLGVHADVQERVGDLASPTILVDGVDVMTDRTGDPPVPACRLDLPTEARVWAALNRRTGAAHTV